MSKINNKNSTIKRVLLQIRPYLPTIILLLALAVVSVLCSLYIPVLVGEAIDAIIGKEQVNFAVILPKLFTCAVHSAGPVADECLRQQGHVQHHPRYARGSL